MANKKIIYSLLLVFVAMLGIVTTTFAWFYFPSSESLTIETAPLADITVNVYHMEYDSNSSAYKYMLLEETNGSFTASQDIQFFEWGGEYICEIGDVEYYAIECIYESSAYANGNIRSIVDAVLNAESDYYLNNTYIRFPLVKLSYTYSENVNSSSVDFTSAAFATQSKALTYTPITFTETDASTDAILESEATFGEVLNTLPQHAYNHTYLEDGNQINELRILIILKIEANTDEVNNEMEAMTEFGTTTEIAMTNTITFNFSFRSVPAKAIED